MNDYMKGILGKPTGGGGGGTTVDCKAQAVPECVLASSGVEIIIISSNNTMNLKCLQASCQPRAAHPQPLTASPFA
jgi:hypothetical protein